MIKLKSSSLNHKLQEIILLDKPAHQNIILVNDLTASDNIREVFINRHEIFL